jgi:hypothetical protein
MNFSPGTIGRPETAHTPCGRGTCSAGALPLPGLVAAAAGAFPGAAVAGVVDVEVASAVTAMRSPPCGAERITDAGDEM